MPNYISQIQLPSGGSYEVKDATARTDIATEASTRASEVTRLEGLIGSITSIKFVVAWSGETVPVVANIPQGVVVTYNGTNYTGTKSPSTAEVGTFYLVHSSSETRNTFDEYVVIGSTPYTYYWEKIGTTDVDLSGYVTNVTLNQQTDVVLGEATTFTASGTAVTPSTTYLGATASGTAVGKTTKYLSASASGTAVGANGTASAVTGYPNTTTATAIDGFSLVSGNLVTDTVNGMATTGSASTWSFTMGTGTDAETLIISGTNSVAPTVAQKTFATGAIGDGTGDEVVTDVTTDASHTHQVLASLGTPSTATVLTGVKVTTQPTITLTANASTDTGRITYVESLGTVTQPTITLASNSSSATGRVQVATGISSVTQPSITVGTNDKVTALTSATDVSVTR